MPGFGTVFSHDLGPLGDFHRGQQSLEAKLFVNMGAEVAVLQPLLSDAGGGAHTGCLRRSGPLQLQRLR